MTAVVINDVTKIHRGKCASYHAQLNAAATDSAHNAHRDSPSSSFSVPSRTNTPSTSATNSKTEKYSRKTPVRPSFLALFRRARLKREGFHVFNAREQHNVHLHHLLHHNPIDSNIKRASYLLFQLDISSKSGCSRAGGRGSTPPSFSQLRSGCRGCRRRSTCAAAVCTSARSSLWLCPWDAA